MTPARRFRGVEGEGVKPSVQFCLGVLGLDYKIESGTTKLKWDQARHQGFWDREEANLPYILYDARKAYLALAKEVHPDKGGSEERMKQINMAWARIEELFDRHGVRL